MSDLPSREPLKVAGYRDPFQGEPWLRKSVVAFLDILGYKKHIESLTTWKESQEELLRLRKALDNAYSYLWTYLSPPRPEKERGFEIRAFTDCLVIGKPILGVSGEQFDPSLALFWVMSYVGCFQMELARMGYFVRGAIAIGDLYVDAEMVFGQALLDAYRAEQSRAIYPRVILHESAAKHYKAENYASTQSTVRNVLLDSDGLVFVDYLFLTVVCDEPEDEQTPFDRLRDHKASVEARLARHADDRTIRSKYEWVARYHNTFCEQCHFEEEGYGDFKIDIAPDPRCPQPWQGSVC